MKTAILGGGTWGIALAKLLAENGNDVKVWSALPEEIEMLKSTSSHKNLPGIPLPDTIQYTTELSDAISDSDYIIFAVASAYIRTTAKAAAPYIKERHTIVDVAKGMESGTLYTMTEVIGDELKKNGVSFPLKLVALSGPTHAEEVAANLPTSIVSACEDEKVAEDVARLFMNSCMRVYTNTDIKGVELCGALKNIVALASGISGGMGYGDNTTAMLITRGIAEMTRMGLAMGCRRRTFSGLAGIGDLIVTCTSRHSRNNTCGRYIGEGLTYEDASKKVGMVVEGYYALDAAMALSEKLNVDMPIISGVYDIVKKGERPEDAIRALMNREMRSELD